jgi:hypothetical protein
MKINYGLIAVQHIDGINFRILHFCGYEDPPTDIDKDLLKKELKSDVEFGLTDEDYIIITADPHIVRQYAKMLNNNTL